jgi:acetyl-CoA decarbonylase/synthase complex subunit delta
MAPDLAKTNYNGKIKEIEIGTGDKKITAGGETGFPFYLFEAKMPHPPHIAMEVWDTAPVDWAPAALEPFADVVSDPVAWAKRCIDRYGAEAIALELVSTDPNGENRDAGAAAAVVKKVADAINVPLIVWGTANHDKDTEVLRQVAEVCHGKHIVLAPLENEDYKRIGAAAIGYNQTVTASSPIDINLAKQLNILMGNLGIPDNLILMDPTVSSIGYGIEYCYSVMERIRLAALTQADEKLQYPIIGNVSKEVWKTKEAKAPELDEPRLGDATRRGILLEAMSAATLMLAGADILVMRHPEAIRLVKEIIAELSEV